MPSAGDLQAPVQIDRFRVILPVVSVRREQLWTAPSEGAVWICELLSLSDDPTIYVEIRRDGRLMFGRAFTARTDAEQWGHGERTHLALD